MKTPMNVLTNMKKKKKNRKGFSLVELIVVLVIMAILAAALVPTLVGYIKQARQSNAKNEAASCVSAAQTIASSAYAASSQNASGVWEGKYSSNSSSNSVKLTFAAGGVTVDSAYALTECIADLSEASDGNLVKVAIDEDAKVVGFLYDDGKTAVLYDGKAYEADTTGSFSTTTFKDAEENAVTAITLTSTAS